MRLGNRTYRVWGKLAYRNILLNFVKPLPTLGLQTIRQANSSYYVNSCRLLQCPMLLPAVSVLAAQVD